MFMAAGFAMLEAGLVRSKNTTEILTKNIALYAVACTMFMVCGYSIMYGGGDFTMFLSGIIGDGVAGAEEPATYAPSSLFLPSCICRGRYVNRFWCGCRANEAMVILSVCGGDDWIYLPYGRQLDLRR
jgi:hypothetical protein